MMDDIITTVGLNITSHSLILLAGLVIGFKAGKAKQ